MKKRSLALLLASALAVSSFQGAAPVRAAMPGEGPAVEEENAAYEIRAEEDGEAAPSPVVTTFPPETDAGDPEKALDASETAYSEAVEAVIDPPETDAPDPEVVIAALEEWSYAAEDAPQDLETYLDTELTALVEESSGDAARNGDRLTGLNRELYDALRDRVEKVAAGEETATSLDVQLDVSAYEGQAWSAEDLGIESLVAETDSGLTISAEAHAAMTELTGYDRELVILSLLRDCPAEMYWFGLGYYCGVPYAVFSSEGGYRIRMTGEVSVIFSVSDDYAAHDAETGEAVRYTTDPAAADRVKAALANAADIIREGQALGTDRERLSFYYQKLPELSGYDYAAAAGAPYGDPWQIVNIFDGDPETMVVCEGYSKGFQYLCDHTEFDSEETSCLCAVGVQTWEGADQPRTTHMWNVVRMDDGNNYLVDVTNGAGFTWLFLAPCVKGNMEEGYYIHAETLNGKEINYLYIYDSDTKHLFPEESLRLAGNETPPVTPTPTAVPTPTPEPTSVPVVTKAPTPTPVRAVRIASAALKTKADGKLVYNGKARKPEVIVKAKAGGKLKTLKKGTDYTLTYKSNKKVGTATIVVKGKGKYTGTRKVTFKILPKGTSISSVKGGNGKFTAKWKKQAVQTTGYQLSYSTAKNMTGAKNVRVKGTGKLSRTVKGLKKGKTYYVRVRTYRTVNGKNYYSAWSKKVKVKV